MVKSGNYNFENKTFILSVKYGTVLFVIERVATLSVNIAVTMHNLQCKILANYLRPLLGINGLHTVQRARRPKLLHIPSLYLH